MRSRTSFFNGTIFKKNITHYWPVWIVFFLYLICVIPVAIFFRTSYMDASYTAEEIVQIKSGEYYSVLNDALSPMIAFGMGVLSALAVYYYLYNGKSAHAFHAFPVRRGELFVTNYVSGFLFYTLPLLLSFFMGACVCALKGITSLEYLLAWFLLMEGMTFFFYNMAIFVGMFTGQFFVVPLLTLILNYLYVGCRSAALSVMGIISYGLNDIYAGRTVSILSPLPFLLSKAGFLVEWNGNQSVCSAKGLKYVAIYVIVAVFLGIVSFFMYRKRKIEVTGDIFIIKAVKPLFRWGAAGSVSMLAATVVCSGMPVAGESRKFALLLVLMLILGVIVFFAAEMLLQRSFKVFQKKRLLECGVYSALMALFLFAVEMDMFGMERKLPDKSEIVSAQVQLYYPLYEEGGTKISEVLAVHRQIIESKEEFESYYERSGQGDVRTANMEIRYTLKDGTPFIRNYNIPVGEDYLARKDSVVSRIQKLSCDVEAYLRGNICLNYKEAEVKEIAVEVYDEELDSHTITVEEKDWAILYNALKQDIREGNILGHFEDEYTDTNDYNYWNTLNIHIYAKNGIKEIWAMQYGEDMWSEESIAYISLNRDCVNTIGMLRELGIINDSDRRLLTAEEYAKSSDTMEEE